MSGALEVLRGCDAVLDGHFVLSSGLHSSRYIQCARAFVDPAVGRQLVEGMAPRLRSLGIDMVVGPAMGGILVAYEIAAQIGTRCCFTEREQGTMVLRRGFHIPTGSRVLISEDVVTTARSSLEVKAILEAIPVEVVAVACLVDRSGGRAAATLGVPVCSLVQIDVPTYPADACPQCAQGIPATKPGSRPEGVAEKGEKGGAPHVALDRPAQAI